MPVTLPGAAPEVNIRRSRHTLRFSFEKDAARGGILRILCIQTGPMHELLLTLPAFRPLGERFGQARIALACSPEAASALTSHPELSSILAYDPDRPSLNRKTLRQISHGGYDLAIGFGGNRQDVERLIRCSRARHRIAHRELCADKLLTMRPACQGKLYEATRHLDLTRRLGCCGTSGEVRLPYGLPEAAAERRMLRDAVRPLIGIHPGAGQAFQRWPGQDFGETARLVSRSCGGTSVITCSPEGRELAEEASALLPDDRVIVSSPLPPRHLQALYAQLDLLITADVTAMHLAAGVGTPVVAVFGQMEPRRWSPESRGSEPVWIHLRCREACSGRVCSADLFGRCLAAVSPEMVAEAAGRALGSRRTHFAQEEAA